MVVAVRRKEANAEQLFAQVENSVRDLKNAKAVEDKIDALDNFSKSLADWRNSLIMRGKWGSMEMVAPKQQIEIAKRGVMFVLRTLQDKNEEYDVRFVAVQIAGELRMKAAVPLLKEVFNNENTDLNLKTEIIKSLGAIGGREVLDFLKGAHSTRPLDPKLERLLASTVKSIEAEFVKENQLELGRALDRVHSRVYSQVRESMKIFEEKPEFPRKIETGELDKIRLQASDVFGVPYDPAKLKEMLGMFPIKKRPEGKKKE